MFAHIASHLYTNSGSLDLRVAFSNVTGDAVESQRQHICRYGTEIHFWVDEVNGRGRDHEERLAKLNMPANQSKPLPTPIGKL
jgi:hypothetical protein